jgi:tetratricopeptide (TPR) repeat protein
VSGEEGRDLGWLVALAQAAGEHLARYPFMTLVLQPVLYTPLSPSESSSLLDDLLGVARLFQQEAYREQTDCRIVSRPILVVPGDSDLTALKPLVDVLRENLATPTLLLLGNVTSQDQDLSTSPWRELEVWRGADQSGDAMAPVLERLRAHHAFDSALARLEDGDEILGLCRRHVVVDPARARVYPCFGAWDDDRDGLPLEPGALPGLVADRCRGCLARGVLAAGRDLASRGLEEDGSRVCFQLGLSLSAVGDHDGAAAQAWRAAQLARTECDKAAALLHYGLCRLDTGDPSAADKGFEMAALHGAQEAQVANYRGRAAAAMGKHGRALELYQEAFSADPPAETIPEIHLAAATSAIGLGRLSDALVHLERATGAGNDSVVAFQKGFCHLSQGRHHEALGHFQDAVRLGPAEADRPRTLIFLGTCLKELERYQEAVEILAPAAESYPTHLAIQNLLGFCFYKLKRHEEAVACFRKAVEIEPDSALDWSNLAANLRDLGRRDEAIAMYRHALSLDPELSFAVEGLARLTSSPPGEPG